MKFYNKILNSIILPLSEFVFNIPLTKTRNILEKTTQLSRDSIEKIQQEKLQNLLAFSVENSTYYKNLEITLDQKNPLENLKKFPILTKEILKKQTPAILTQPKEKLIKKPHNRD